MHTNCYLESVKSGFINFGENLDYTIPSGNFGSMYSAWNLKHKFPRKFYEKTEFWSVQKLNFFAGWIQKIHCPLFLNSLKAIVAKKLGIPFDNLLVATNENRVLADVFDTGIYSTQDRKLVKTLSCAMVFGQKLKFKLPSNKTILLLIYFLTSYKIFLLLQILSDS